MEKEAQARIKINKLLEVAGWRFFPDANGPANIRLETHVKITQHVLDALGNDFEKTQNGFIDFLLLDPKGFPVAVLEAKRQEKEPLDGKEQARTFATGCGVHFVTLSNGEYHYFWDIEKDNPTIISTFPTPDSLEHRRDFRPDPKNLVNEPVGHDYIVLTQRPDYQNDPRWKDPARRAVFLKDKRRNDTNVVKTFAKKPHLHW